MEVRDRRPPHWFTPPPAGHAGTRFYPIYPLALTSIVCFGYVNETSLHYSLVSFWFAYRCLHADFEQAHA